MSLGDAGRHAAAAGDVEISWADQAGQRRSAGLGSVAEIAFDGVQRSPRYPGGVALRFARVLRYRPDKRPEDADTIDAVRAVQPG